MTEPDYIATTVTSDALLERLRATERDDVPHEASAAMETVCAALWGITGGTSWRKALAYAETPESGDIHRMAVAHTKRLARATVAALRDAGLLRESEA